MQCFGLKSDRPRSLVFDRQLGNYLFNKKKVRLSHLDFLYFSKICTQRHFFLTSITQLHFDSASTYTMSEKKSLWPEYILIFSEFFIKKLCGVLVTLRRESNEFLLYNQKVLWKYYVNSRLKFFKSEFLLGKVKFCIFF